MTPLGRLAVWRRVIARGVFPHQFSWVLELPWRRIVLSPEALASRLPIGTRSAVLELGAGSGYYSIEVARRVRTGRLELFDLQAEMLERCRAKCAPAGLTNVGYIVGDAAALPFGRACFDVVFMVAVLGEVRDRAGGLTSIRRVLKPGGVLSISEHLPDPDFTTLRSLRRHAERVGLVVEHVYGLPWAYTANLRSP